MRTPFIRTFFLAVMILSSELLASSQRPLLEFKTGYFFFADPLMREIYNNGGLDIQMCATYPVYCITDRWTIQAYGAVEYFYLSGGSGNDEQNTSVWSVPFNIGLKPTYAISANMDYYFAIGPRFFYIHQHNSSPFVIRNSSCGDVGFFVNTGFNFVPCNRVVLDLFGEYSWAKTHFQGGSSIYTRNIQVGGFTFGGGLGYAF